MSGSNTKPPGPKTGLTSPGCYAGALQDCDGGPCTKEHYTTKNLLEKIGDSFEVSGLPWIDGVKALTASALVARILCKRHNNALSPLDATIGRLYEALVSYHEGHDIGQLTISGEDLERWALKVWAGKIASANVAMKDGTRFEKSLLPIDYLSILFGDAEMPEGWGLNFFEKGREALPFVDLAVYLATQPEGHEQAGEIYGVVVVTLGCPFVMVMTRLASNFGRLWYRPAALLLGNGRIDLAWSRPTTTEPIVLKTPPASKQRTS